MTENKIIENLEELIGKIKDSSKNSSEINGKNMLLLALRSRIKLIAELNAVNEAIDNADSYLLHTDTEPYKQYVQGAITSMFFLDYITKSEYTLLRSEINRL